MTFRGVEFPAEYFSRMDSASDDKSRLLAELHDGMHILDVGAGGGTLTKRILDTFPHCKVTALDVNPVCIEQLNGLKQKYGERLQVLQEDFLKYAFPGQQYDAVVFCSCIHEIFSFSEPQYDPQTITACLAQAVSITPPGGKILIRDGIKPSTNRPVRIDVFDWEMTHLLSQFDREFHAFLPTMKFRAGGWITNEQTAAEALLTCNWGAKSFPREVKEWYAYFSEQEWRDVIRRFRTVELTSFDAYVQEGYVKNLQPKVRCILMETKEKFFPLTNMFICLNRK